MAEIMAIEDISTGVFVLTADYQFKYANPAASKLLGVPAEHLEAISPAISNISPSFARLLNRIVKGEFRKIKKPEQVQITAHGQYLTVTISKNDESDYILEVTHLQQQDISKSTHELKRPIQNIKALIEALTMGAKNDPVLLDKYLNNISKESDRLSRLVTDMLKLNYLARGVIEPRKQEVLLAPLVNKIFASLATKADKQEVQLKSTLADRAVVVGDPELLEHLLDNLIDNAIKYNHQGGSVKVEQTEPHSVVVRDTGIGILKDDIEKLGEEFYRATGSESIPGTGLGLTLVRSIVDLHGGELKVESTQGQGSVFTVCL